jgi:hypothetical protein
VVQDRQLLRRHLMAKKAKQPALAPPSLSPWMLCIWRGELERCHYAVVRCEMIGGSLTGVQAVFVDSSGMVQWTRLQGQWRTAKGEMRSAMDLIYPTTTDTTAEAMLEYFKRRLLLVGGSTEAYQHLGVQKPQVVQTPAGDGDPDKTRELTELYKRAAKLLDVPVDELRERYSHLNKGLQAMNLRNRLRAKGYQV